MLDPTVVRGGCAIPSSMEVLYRPHIKVRKDAKKKKMDGGLTSDRLKTPAKSHGISPEMVHNLPRQAM